MRRTREIQQITVKMTNTGGSSFTYEYHAVSAHVTRVIIHLATKKVKAGDYGLNIEDASKFTVDELEPLRILEEVA